MWCLPHCSADRTCIVGHTCGVDHAGSVWYASVLATHRVRATRKVIATHEVLATWKVWPHVGPFMFSTLTRVNLLRRALTRRISHGQRRETYCRHIGSAPSANMSPVGASPRTSSPQPGSLMSPEVPLDFDSSLFHSGLRVAPATVFNAIHAIKDPLWFGFGLAHFLSFWLKTRE